MSLSLGKVLAKGDSTLVGIGDRTIVVTRKQVEKSIQAKAQDNNPLQKKCCNELSKAEQEILSEMQARDIEVRQHEQKHMQAAGSLAKGSPQFSYQIGPDGKPYATGGKIRIDTTPVPGDENANRAKANLIQNAAMAPGDPSLTDLLANNKISNRNRWQSIASINYNLNSPFQNEKDPTQKWPLHLFA